MSLQEDLESFGFTRRGTITIGQDKNEPYFSWSDQTASKTLKGNVYLWVVEEDELPKEVLYIGKTGKTISGRGSDHLSGFRNGNRGRKISDLLKEVLIKDKVIGIYGRHSDRIIMFGQEVSLCETEEKALINRYKKKIQFI
jgi:hypothetical protein